MHRGESRPGVVRREEVRVAIEQLDQRRAVTGADEIVHDLLQRIRHGGRSVHASGDLDVRHVAVVLQAEDLEVRDRGSRIGLLIGVPFPDPLQLLIDETHLRPVWISLSIRCDHLEIVQGHVVQECFRRRCDDAVGEEILEFVRTVLPDRLNGQRALQPTSRTRLCLVVQRRIRLDVEVVPSGRVQIVREPAPGSARHILSGHDVKRHTTEWTLESAGVDSRSLVHLRAEIRMLRAIFGGIDACLGWIAFRLALKGERIRRIQPRIGVIVRRRLLRVDALRLAVSIALEWTSGQRAALTSDRLTLLAERTSGRLFSRSNGTLRRRERGSRSGHAALGQDDLVVVARWRHGDAGAEPRSVVVIRRRDGVHVVRPLVRDASHSLR
jgi:hypothetical protein